MRVLKKIKKTLFPLSNINERIVFQLFSLVKSVVANRYRDVLREFEELDEKNTKRLTQEDMYQLLKRWHNIQKKIYSLTFVFFHILKILL